MAAIDTNTNQQNSFKIDMTDGVLVPERNENTIFSAWRISFVGAIALLFILFFFSESNLRRIMVFVSYTINQSVTLESHNNIKNELSVSTIPGNVFRERIIKPVRKTNIQKKFMSLYMYDEKSDIFEISPGLSEKEKVFVLDTIYSVYLINPFAEALKFVPDGIKTTFIVTVLAIFFASLIGLLVGLGRISRITFINRIATIYVEIIRGIPLLVQLFYIYYALAKIVNIEGIASAVIAMSVCYGAYIGEIFRAGIQSIPKGQMEAALALGMTRSQAIMKIILPQTFKVVLPPIGNEFIALLKDSSLVSILAVADLLRRGREYASKTFYYFETYTVIALVYLILTLFFSRVVGIMEEQLKKRG